MKYDVGNLEARLRRDAALAGSPAAGGSSSTGASVDALRSDRLSPRLKRRAELAAKARAALDAFSATAAKSKDPNAVTRGLLVELGRKQQEAARWIAAAALEEELSRMDGWADFMTPELLAAIDAVPVSEDARASYRRRGEAIKTAVADARATAERAVKLLKSDSWSRSLGEVDALRTKTRTLQSALSRDVGDYSHVPFLIAQARVRQPRWRDWLDEAALRWAPGLPYSRAVAERRGALARGLNAFSMIVAGDTVGAHALLISRTP